MFTPFMGSCCKGKLAQAGSPPLRIIPYMEARGANAGTLPSLRHATVSSRGWGKGRSAHAHTPSIDGGNLPAGR